MANYNDARQVQDKLTELERRMRSIETVSRVESASVGGGGIKVYDGGTVDFLDGGELQIGDTGSINIHGGSLSIRGTGEMNVDGSAEFRNTTSLTGNTTFGGALNISSGSLSLPSGSISNDALAEQLEIKYARATESGWGLGTSWSTIISTSLSTPKWATRANVLMQGFYIAEHKSGSRTGARISGRCAGAVVDGNYARTITNENGVYGSIGRTSWSTVVSSPASSLSCNVMGVADVSGDTPSGGKSWAEVTMMAIYMR